MGKKMYQKTPFPMSSFLNFQRIGSISTPLRTKRSVAAWSVPSSCCNSPQTLGGFRQRYSLHDYAFMHIYLWLAHVKCHHSYILKHRLHEVKLSARFVQHRSSDMVEGPRDALSSCHLLHKLKIELEKTIGIWPWRSLKVIGNGTIR